MMTAFDRLILTAIVTIFFLISLHRYRYTCYLQILVIYNAEIG